MVAASKTRKPGTVGVLLVAGVLVLASLFLSTPSAAADGTWMYYSHQLLAAPILGLSYQHISFTVTHERERHTLNWTTGLVAVNFHILDQTNYDNWTHGRPWTALVDHLGITGEYFQWHTWDKNAVFHFIWYNPSPISTSLAGTYDVDQWMHIEGNIPGFPWQAVLIGLACPIALLITSRRRRPANKEHRPENSKG